MKIRTETVPLVMAPADGELWRREEIARYSLATSGQAEFLLPPCEENPAACPLLAEVLGKRFAVLICSCRGPAGWSFAQ